MPGCLAWLCRFPLSTWTADAPGRGPPCWAGSQHGPWPVASPSFPSYSCLPGPPHSSAPFSPQTPTRGYFQSVLSSICHTFVWIYVYPNSGGKEHMKTETFCFLCVSPFLHPRPPSSCFFPLSPALARSPSLLWAVGLGCVGGAQPPQPRCCPGGFLLVLGNWGPTSGLLRR